MAKRSAVVARGDRGGGGDRGKEGGQGEGGRALRAAGQVKNGSMFFRSRPCVYVHTLQMCEASTADIRV